MVDQDFFAAIGAKKKGVDLPAMEDLCGNIIIQIGVMDRTPKPATVRLLADGVREFLWSQRPKKFTHYYQLADWIDKHEKGDKVRVLFAGGDSALECVSKALRAGLELGEGAVSPILICACDGWIIIIICILIFILNKKKKKNGQWWLWLVGVIVYRIIPADGLGDVVKPLHVCEYILQHYPGLSIGGFCTAALLNGGANCPRLVPSLPAALELVERHQNNLVKVVEELTPSPKMPKDPINFLIDETLATLYGPVLSDHSDEHIAPLLPINKDFVVKSLGQQYWDRLVSGAARLGVGVTDTRGRVTAYGEGRLRAPLSRSRSALQDAHG
ncbi:unnamed protein product [Vitrella brassicaformis CCMP3155]|uniref:Uncharacterized protein n=1 Tax=Vitrella brassicaformis (strain CCMP3155) TaxID=1169540 RepID=A0A0G4ES76_VITBC|nr:unnamed protein product [Vitrella brassicaformis CCMP3155]|eukprot:CEM00710.1 unnamed protein product [Vitrella brassicaformis CCMP3155]